MDACNNWCLFCIPRIWIDFIFLAQLRIMKKVAFSFLLMILVPAFGIAQAKIRKLPPTINHPSLNLTAPYMSADGNALVFVSDGGQDGGLIVSYTFRDRDWNPPADLPKHLNTRLNFLKGYALSADGRTIYLTSAKSPTVGGYDIVSAEIKGATWSSPVNLMMPINSKANEGCPSITPDGKTMFFMRCDVMDQYKADGCKIFFSKRAANGQWTEPVEMPASVNTGNSQVPRILPDGETLIFSSDKMGGKGGMDLFVTSLENGEWSSPIPLDFTNTDRDDQYVSVTAIGRYLLREAKGARNNYELTEFLFPAELRPTALTKVVGTITSPDGGIVSSYISVTDTQTGKRIISERPAADGSYSFYLREGKRYELSVDPEQSQLTYFSRLFDLTGERIPQQEKVDIKIKKPAIGDVIPLDLVSFKESGSELTGVSSKELQRFARMVKANPELRFEVKVELSGFREDSLQSSADFTELRVDSVLVHADTTLQIPEHKIAKLTYHNDRTVAQAEAILQFLNKEGVKPEQIDYVVEAEPSDADPVVSVRAVVVR